MFLSTTHVLITFLFFLWICLPCAFCLFLDGRSWAVVIWLVAYVYQDSVPVSYLLFSPFAQELAHVKYDQGMYATILPF
ncbi:hypothetical protein BJY04DRAFT_50909 [Aspergillus karnatakaensis]|uniref:uncharacterized protein n=1 Tax=Aspergillus karnatakaensis TaxID=1810916 RepID=UPI003CCC92B1